MVNVAACVDVPITDLNGGRWHGGACGTEDGCAQW